MEGVAYSLRECVQTVGSLGVATAGRRLLGGGSRSELWGQILTDVLGEPLVKPEVEDAAFGAALLAGLSAGLFSGWAEAVGSCVRDIRTVEPNLKNKTLYDEYFQEYQEITRDLREHSRRLASLSMEGRGEAGD
jgi:xylulokinase